MNIGTYNLRISVKDESVWPWSKLFWVKRMRRIAKVISDIGLDIVCTQEAASRIQLAVLSLFMPKRYKYSSHTESPNSRQRNAVFYDSTKYTAVHSYRIDLPGDRCASCVWLREHATGKLITVASTHITLNGHEMQMASIDALADKLISENVYLCGDFNFEPTETPYEYMKVKLSNMADTRKSGNSKCTYTGFDDTHCRTIDYIFAPLRYAAKHRTAIGGDALCSDHRLVYTINN